MLSHMEDIQKIQSATFVENVNQPHFDSGVFSKATMLTMKPTHNMPGTRDPFPTQKKWR